MSRATLSPSEGTAPVHPAVRYYQLYTLAGLFALAVCLMDGGGSWWCLLPAGLGVAALVGRWSIGPPLVLLSTMVMLLTFHRSRWISVARMRRYSPEPMDLLLCVAVMAYVIGHYRLLALVRPLFPTRVRSQRGGSTLTVERCRDADSVSSVEKGLAILTLPLWTGLATLILVKGLLRVPRSLAVSRVDWMALLAAWAIGAVLIVVGAAAKYIRLRLMTREEALLFLQDQLWRSTRREQSQLQRWRMWARLRAERRRKRT